MSNLEVLIFGLVVGLVVGFLLALLIFFKEDAFPSDNKDEDYSWMVVNFGNNLLEELGKKTQFEVGNKGLSKFFNIDPRYVITLYKNHNTVTISLELDLDTKNIKATIYINRNIPLIITKNENDDTMHQVNRTIFEKTVNYLSEYFKKNK